MIISLGISELTNVLAKHKVYTDLLSIEKDGLDKLETDKGDNSARALWLKDVLAKVKYFAKDSLPLLLLLTGRTAQTWQH